MRSVKVHSAASASTTGTPHAPPCRAWRDAARWLSSIFFYALCSISCAWLATLCISQGLVFSGQSGPRQSRAVFLTGVLLWAHVIFCASVMFMRAMALFSLHLVSDPSRPAGAWRVLYLITLRTLPWFTLCGLVLSAIGMGLGARSKTWRQFKLELYLSSVVYFSYVAVVDQAARRLYRRETVEGSRARVRRSSSRVGRTPSVRRTLRIAVAKLSLLFALLVPVWYVHAVSSITTITDATSVVWIILGSLLFKVLMQEATKRFVLRQGMENARSMAALVCMPTVIVDTQIRIVFMRFQSVMAGISSTLVMAATELVLRLVKASLMKRRIALRRAEFVNALVPLEGVAKAASADAYEVWKKHLERHSVMELSAAMFAEYSAIGCSCAIMVFFGQHSQYSLGVSTQAASLTSSYGTMLVFQVGVEMVVDYVSCVVELLQGVDLAAFYSERHFLFVFFLAITLLNINVSSTLYLAN